MIDDKDLQKNVLWEVGTTLRLKHAVSQSRGFMSNQEITLLLNCNLAKANNKCEHCEEIVFFFLSMAAYLHDSSKGFLPW